MAIGRISTDRNTPRAGSTELSSTAAPRPRAIDSGVTSTVNAVVLTSERQKSPSPSSRA